MITVPYRDWRQLAACRHADPELFFPVSASGPGRQSAITTQNGGYARVLSHVGSHAM
jgi:hypothetical protein